MNRKTVFTFLTAILLFHSEYVSAKDLYFPKNNNWFYFHVLETGETYRTDEEVLTGGYNLTAANISTFEQGALFWETILHPGARNTSSIPVLVQTSDEKDDNVSAFSPVIESGPYTGQTALAAFIINAYHAPEKEYEYITLIQIDRPLSGDWSDAPVSPLPKNGDAFNLSSVLAHELYHALGGAASTEKEASFGDVLTTWDTHLRDINGSAPAAAAQQIISAGETCESASCFVTTEGKDAWGGIYFTGDHVQEVLNGATILPPTEATNRIRVPGLPINTWELDEDENGHFINIPELSHIELQNSLMSHQDYRNWSTFMEAELAVLQDLGYTIDRRNFYGYSVYSDNDAINNRNPFYARENGAFITGKPNTTPYGIGLHIYGSGNDVTQSADLLADGTYGIGVRVDGSENTLKIPVSTKVTANGTNGYGVLFSYGKEHNLVLQGTVEATGSGGKAVVFDFGDNIMGNNNEYRGSYIRTERILILDELDEALITSADITGSVSGNQAAVYIGPSAYVENINIMNGASVNGNIISDWSPVTNREIIRHGNPETLMTTLTFGHTPDANGVKTAAPDASFNATVNGNIQGSESLDMSLNGGKLTVNGTISVHTLTTQADTVLTLPVNNAVKSAPLVSADTITVNGTLAYTFDPLLSGLNTGDILTVLNAETALTWAETDEKFSLESILDYYTLDYVYNRDAGTLGLKVTSTQSKQAGSLSSHAMTTSVISAIGNKIMGRLSGASSADNVKGQSGGDMFKETGLWGKALYTHAHKSGDNAFKADIYGGVIGLDGKPSDEVTLGIALSYSKTDGEAERTGAKADTYAGYLYGKYEQGRWAYNLAAGYGVSRFDIDNTPEFNIRFANVQGYADYVLGNGFTAEGGLRYVFAHQDEYTAGTTRFKAKDTDTLTGVLGGRYAYDTRRFGIQMNLAAIYDFVSDKSAFRATGCGASLYVNGERLHRFGGEAGISATLKANAWTFELGYDTQIRKDYNDQTVNLKAGYRF